MSANRPNQQKILIVDDVAENLLILDKILTKLDVETLKAENGTDALNLIKQHDFVVVILDVDLPDMTGFDIAEKMQAHPDTEDTPIIFVTATSTEQTNVYKGYKSGAVDYMFKPVNPTLLLSKVKVFLKLDQKQRALKQAHIQMMHSQKLESLGKLAGGIAHHFNNLLGGILGYAHMLKVEFHDHQAAYKKLDVIVKSVNQATNLTEQLLGFSQKEFADKMDVDLNQVISEVLNLMERTNEQNIQIKKDLKRDLDLIKADRSQAFELITELLRNAFEAMPNGGRLSVSTDIFKVDGSKTDLNLGSGSYVHLLIEDTGVGIAKEIQSKIFDPFFTTKEVGQGPGLGLSSSHGIVEAHGGAITITSSQGSGTRCHVYLPINEETLSAPSTAEKDLSSQDTSTDLKGKTVLIVDDEEMMRDLIVDMIKTDIADVLIAAGGEESVKIFNEKHEEIDLVILDVMMPMMNGLQVYEEIRSIDSKVPIIFASGYAETEKIRECTQKKETSFIQKPFTPEKLLDLIRATQK